MSAETTITGIGENSIHLEDGYLKLVGIELSRRKSMAGSLEKGNLLTFLEFCGNEFDGITFSFEDFTVDDNLVKTASYKSVANTVIVEFPETILSVDKPAVNKLYSWCVGVYTDIDGSNDYTSTDTDRLKFTGTVELRSDVLFFLLSKIEMDV